MQFSASPDLRDRDRRRRPIPASTPFIGRTAELDALRSLLLDPTTSLVTITGRAGSGRTRLALEAASAAGDAFPGGAVLLDLGAVAGPSAVPSLVASALDLRAFADLGAERTLRRSLRYLPTLLVADDADLVPGALEALLAVLDERPASRILATAAAPTRRPGERVLRLSPLGTPDPTATRATEVGAAAAAVLFVERSASAAHSFTLTDDNAPAVRDLVRRLDGLPLAIELAAARSPVLAPAAQLALFDREGALGLAPRRVAASAGDAAPLSLREAIDLSYRLAGERERVVLRRMAVVGGSASLETLGAVGVEAGWGEGDLLDALMTLVDLHLVEPEPGSPAGRFRLLPTIAEFARERLDESGERATVEAAFVDHFAAVAAASRTAPELERMALLEEELENLHAALARLIERGDLERSLMLLADIAPAWERHGYFERQRAWTDRLIDLAEARLAAGDGGRLPAALSQALSSAVLCEVNSMPGEGRAPAVKARVDRATELARASGDIETLLLALWAATASVFVTGEMGTAVAAATEGLATAPRLGDPEWTAYFEQIASMAIEQTGDHATAARIATSGLEHARASGAAEAWVRLAWHVICMPPETPGLPDPMPTIGEVLEAAHATGDVGAQSWLRGGQAVRCAIAGDQAAAAEWALAAMERAAVTGSWFATGIPYAGLAIVAGQRGEPETVARLSAAIKRMQAPVIVALSRARVDYLAAVERARAMLGAGRFEQIEAEAFALGWRASLDHAMRYAAGLARPRPVEPGAAADTAGPVPDEPVSIARRRPRPVEPLAVVDRLTPRETEVLRELAHGHTNNEIAEHLGMRPKTVMHHSVSIYAKLGVRGRAEATAWAFRNGLMGDERAG